MNAELLAKDFVTHAREVLQKCLKQVVRCVDLLNDAELWHRENEHTNSVANLVLHLAGNVRQWVLGGLGGVPVTRDRPAEFSARGSVDRDLLRADLLAVLHEADRVLERLDAEALARTYTIQTYVVTGLVAVFHVVEHFSGHTGQIVHMCKRHKDIDLSLYDAEGKRPPGEVMRP